MNFDISQAIASYQQVKQKGYRRLHQILSNPKTRQAIARDGLPVLWRQHFVGITEVEVLHQLEAYLARVTQHLADGTTETDTMETNLAVRVATALDLKKYEPKEYVVVVIDDQVKGVWDRTTFRDRWFELTSSLNHDRYKAELLVTRFLGKNSAVMQLTCSSAVWDQEKAKAIAIRATKQRIVIWENMNFTAEIETDEYVLEFPTMMPLHCVMNALKEREYPSDITQWRHVI